MPPPAERGFVLNTVGVDVNSLEERWFGFPSDDAAVRHRRHVLAGLRSNGRGGSDVRRPTGMHGSFRQTDSLASFCSSIIATRLKQQSVAPQLQSRLRTHLTLLL